MEMSRWSQVEIAQLATFIDCEGNIAIHINKCKAAHAMKSDQFSLRLNVANTYYPVIQYLQQTFGGGIQFQDRTAKNPQWRPHYRWWVNATSAMILLELCLPYFHIKREEAEVAIGFQRRLNAYATIRPWRAPVAPSEVEWRREQMQILSALKHRVFSHLDTPGV